MDTEEGKHLPVIHCVEGTWGHQLEDDVLRLKNENDKTFIKHTFPSLELGRFLEEQQYQKIELCGLVSNICVLSNAVIAKSACPNAHIVIDAKATASFDLDLHNKALDVLEGLHIEVKNRG
jgi:nicotinamidase-related amidase